MDRLTNMEAFVRVVDAGSFSAAARQWGRSKAVVSKYVAALEHQLGTELLRRTTRSLSLTVVGEEYHRRCTDLLAELDAMDARVQTDRQSPRGVLRVSVPPGFLARYLSLVTTELLERHPELELDLDVTHRMVDLVEEGIDVAIRLTDPDDSALVARRLAPAPVVAVVSPAYLEQHGRPRRPRDLRSHACLVDTNFRDQQRWRFKHEGRIETVSVRGPVRANSPLVTRQLALDGLGIACIPKLLVEEDLRHGRLKEVLRGKVALNWSIWAVMVRRRYVSARVRAFVDHLAAGLA